MYIMTLPKSVEYIIEQLELHGYSAYVVGGCVRDFTLGKEPHDYDICTSATPAQVKEVFAKSRHKTYDTGIEHGTISVAADHNLYEITTYRLDGTYKDGRHPENVEFVTDITQDLSRRDFTINAMAYNHSKGFIDPFNGKEDLENKMIRCVGDPTQRFQEDALRIMRAIRFAATYGFIIESETAKAIHKNKHLLKNVSEERKTVEFVKFITYTNAELLTEYRDVLAEFIPEIKLMFDFDQKSPWHLYDIWTHTAKVVEQTPNDTVIRMAAFFHDIGKPDTYTYENGCGHFHGHALQSKEMTKEIMKRMRFDNKSIREVTDLIGVHSTRIHPDRTSVKKLLYQMGEENLRRLVPLTLADSMSHREPWDVLQTSNDLSKESVAIRDRIYRVLGANEMIDQVKNSGECYQLKQLAINGKDLVEIGFPQNKTIKDALDQLMNVVIENPKLNNKSTLIEYTQKKIPYRRNIIFYEQANRYLAL